RVEDRRPRLSNRKRETDRRGARPPLGPESSAYLARCLVLIVLTKSNAATEIGEILLLPARSNELAQCEVNDLLRRPRAGQRQRLSQEIVVKSDIDPHTVTSRKYE